MMVKINRRILGWIIIIFTSVVTFAADFVVRPSDGVSAVISKDRDLIYFLDGNLSKICQISSSGLDCYSDDFPAISTCTNGDFVVATGHGVARLNIVNGNAQVIPPHYNNDFWVKDVAGLSNGDIGVVSLSCQGYYEEIECGEISYISQNKKFSTNDGSFMPIKIIELSNGTILCLSQKDSGLSFTYSIVLFDSDLNKLTTPLPPPWLGNSDVTILKVVADNCFALALDDKTNTINFYDNNFSPMSNLKITLDSPPVDVVYTNGYCIVAEKDKVKNYTTNQILYKTDGDSGNITGLSVNPTNKNSVYVRTEKQYIKIDGLLDPAIPSGATLNVGEKIYGITALNNGKFAVAAYDNNIYIYDSNAYWASTLTVNDSSVGVISEVQGGIIVTGEFGDSSNLYLHYGSGVNDLKRGVDTAGALIKIIPAPIVIFPSTNFMYYVATSQNISLNILSTDSHTLTEYRKLLCFGDETIYDFIQLENNNVVVLTKDGVYLYTFNVDECALKPLATYKYSDNYYQNPFLLEFSKYILLYERAMWDTIGEARIQLNKADLTLTDQTSISTYYTIYPISITQSLGTSSWGWLRNKLQLNLLDENFNSLCYYQFSVSFFAGAVGLPSGNIAVITQSYWAGGTDQVVLFNSQLNLAINSKQFSCSPIGIAKLTNGNFVVATENGDLWVFDQNNMTQIVHSTNTTFTDPE